MNTTCNNCGSNLTPGIKFCEKCGERLSEKTAKEGNQTPPIAPPPVQQPQQQSQLVGAPPPVSPAIPGSQTGNVLQVFAKFFKEPVNGLNTLFKNYAVNAFSITLVMYLATAVLFLAGGFINIGKYGLLYFLFPLIGMVLISLLSFVVKVFLSKPNIREEFFTGAVCAIPYILLLGATLISKLLGETVRGLFGFSSYALSMIVFGFFIVLLVNVVQQSFRASSIKDSAALYSASIVVLLSFFLSSEIYTFLVLQIY